MDAHKHDLLLCGFVRGMIDKDVPKDILTACNSFYPSSITIHIGSFGFDTPGGVYRFPSRGGCESVVDSYIKIPELYGETNLFENGELISINGSEVSIRRGHGIVVLENQFGTLVRSKTIDTWGDRDATMNFVRFVNLLESNCILIMSVHDSGERMSSGAHGRMKKYGVGTRPGFREPMIFVGSTNGARDWTFYKVFDRYNPGKHEQVFTVPLLS